MGLFDFFRTKNKPADTSPPAKRTKLDSRATAEDFLQEARRLGQAGDLKAAIVTLNKAKKNFQTSLELEFLLADCLLRNDQTHEAVRQYQHVSDLGDKDVNVQRSCCKGLIACEEWDEAEMQLYVAKEVFPDDAELLLLQADVFERTNEPTLALGCYRDAWDRAGNDDALKKQAADKIQALGGEPPLPTVAASEPRTVKIFIGIEISIA